MNNHELHKKAQELADTVSPYQLARRLVEAEEDFQCVPVKWLENLRYSIKGDCYMGEDWEIATIDALLSYKPNKESQNA